jgi:putative ABC transport system permease protein
VVVLSDEGLRRYFGCETNVVGKTIFITNEPYSIVGVTPPSFKGTVYPNLPQIYATFRPARAIKEDPPGYLLGRLKPGVSLSQADADLERIAGQLSAEHGSRRTIETYRATAAYPQMLRFMAPLAIVVAVIAAAALWIACSNIAMLLLACGAAGR